MDRKQTIGILVFLAAVVVFIFVLPGNNQDGKKELLPLPTKDNPSPSGLYSNVPPFEEWGWVEEKDENGALIYKIKLPTSDEWIEANDKYHGYFNFLHLDSDKLNINGAKNIEEYHELSGDFLIKGYEHKSNTNLGKYYTHQTYNIQNQYQTVFHFILTKKNVIRLIFDYDPYCTDLSENTNPISNPNLISFCREYMQIYLPIVEKALSTLEIPDYLDDRGFATSTEIKLLPDELRIYEVK